MKTIGSVLEDYKGIGPGFDFLRVVLAITVILHHSFLIVQGDYHTVETYHLWAIFAAPVPMFFALSGFLVSASALRLKLHHFILNRVLRILPALVLVTAFSALLIGPFVTTLPLSEYGADEKLRHYFLNITGFIHYELPGVFLSNPYPKTVNGSVWTLPLEMGSYIIMSCLLLTGAIRSQRRLLVSVIAFSMLYLGLYWYGDSHGEWFAGDTVFDHYIGNFISMHGNYLYLYFLSGALLYAFRYRVPYSGKLALSSTILYFSISAGLVTLGPYAPPLLALPMSYLVAFIGLSTIGKLPIYSHGDYSYGMYLYAYPLQQALVFLFPGMFSVPLHFLCSLVLATCVAMLSWHLVEKPILASRRKHSLPMHKNKHVVLLPQTQREAA